MTTELRQNLGDLETALNDAGFPDLPFASMLERIRGFAQVYAQLERELLGHVWLSVPAHLIAPPDTADWPEQAEALAKRERARLALGKHETGDMMRLLDAEGLKTYRPLGPEGSLLEGLFLFDREVGPLFVVDARLPALEADYTFARLYAHYLMDNDPYRIQIVHRKPGAEMDTSELRSHAFAGAFLIDRLALLEYVAAAGWNPNDGWTRERLEHLALFFEVSYRALVARLLAMGWVQAPDAPTLLELTRNAADPELSPRDASAVPARFTRLALESHAKEGMTLERLAEVLETDRETAGYLAARFRLREEPEPVEEGDEEPENTDDLEEDR